jgi:hypothetical protein
MENEKDWYSFSEKIQLYTLTTGLTTMALYNILMEDEATLNLIWWLAWFMAIFLALWLYLDATKKR